MSDYSYKTSKKVSLCLVFLLFFQLAQGQYNFLELDQKIENAKKAFQGEFVVMVYRNGGVIYQKTMGEMTPKTQVPILYTSQWITAAAVMKLTEEGKLGLGDRMGKFIPDFNKYSKGYITIEQSLAHTTGIEAELPQTWPLPEKSKFSTLEEAITAGTSKKEILSPPGRDFRWCDPGMDFAARAAELANRKGFEQMVQEKILRPLQMRNTQFSAFPYTQPSMGALSTAADLTNFLACLLNQGQWNGKPILSPASVDKLLEAASTTAMIKSAPMAYKGGTPALGSWVVATDEAGKSTINVAPSLLGSWAVLDRCRGYALVIVAGKPMNDDKKEICWQIKAALDTQINAACQ